MLRTYTSRVEPRGRMLVLALAAAVAAVSLSVSQVGAAPPAAPGELLPGRYIVVLEEGAVKPGKGNGPAAVAKDHGVAPDLVYKSAIRGFAAAASAKQAQQLAADPRVASVEPDRLVRALAQSLPTGVDRIDADANPTAAIAEDGGNVSVTVAVIDSGISLEHPDLNVAAGLGMTCASGKKTPDDQNGHGSHVAGTIGALDNGFGVVGVAPGAAVVPVRVLGPNGSGSLSCVVAGIDHVTANAAQIPVANMSLGWQGNSKATREAIQSSVAAGVVYTVAAGNEDADVYGPDGKFASGDEYEPASYPEAAAISALADANGAAGGGGGSTSYGPDDSFATFSNFSGAVVGSNPVSSPGRAIDLLLPGVDIHSTYKDGGYATISGTSMASPHAAGLAALYIAANSRAVDAAGVASIRQALIDVGRNQASGQRLALPGTEPDGFPEPLGWAGSATVNAAPSASGSSLSTEEDSAVTAALEGSDPETCELSFSIVSGPTDGSLGSIAGQACTAGEPNTDTATVTYTPDADFNGEDSFTYEVSDGADADTATVTVAISAVNDPPTAEDDLASTNPDTAVTFDVLANDVDADGDPLSIDRYDASTPAGGTVSCETASGECTYTPPTGFSGEDSFTYEATDGTATSNTATARIGVSSPPSASGSSLSTEEDSAVTAALEGSDPETCELSFSIVSGPTDGSLGSIAGQACTAGEPNTDTATVTYTPDANFESEDSFVFRITDGDGASAEATVTIDVEGVNDPPAASGVSVEGAEDSEIPWTPNVSDPDSGDTLSCSIPAEGGPANGTATVAADCSGGTYTPDTDFDGEDSFAYRVSDGSASDTATVTVTVNPVNDPPSAAAVSDSTEEDSPVTVTLSGSDLETCELAFSIVSGPANGSVGSLSGQPCAGGTPNTDTATVTYTPDADFNGEDSFTYEVSDGADADTATVTVDVEAVDDPPAGGGFLEDFEGDVSSWTASGLWHLAFDTGCVSPGYTSATRSAYFGDESSCSYADRRKQVSGALTSPSIAVSGAATLGFSHWREVEFFGGGAYDRTWVEVSYDGGGSWTQVWYRDSTTASTAAWTAESIALSPPSEAEAAIVRFRFDTIDGVANNYRGWLIDDVEIS